MLADALAAYEDSDNDLLSMAVDIFAPDPGDHAVLAELKGEDYDPPDVNEEHKTTDYSDPHRFDTLRTLIYGTTHGISIEQLRTFIEAGDRLSSTQLRQECVPLRRLLCSWTRLRNTCMTLSSESLLRLSSTLMHHILLTNHSHVSYITCIRSDQLLTDEQSRESLPVQQPFTPRHCRPFVPSSCSGRSLTGVADLQPWGKRTTGARDGCLRAQAMDGGLFQ
jgi:hypothetical protein